MFRKRFKKAGALALAVCVTLGSIQLPALTAKASDENLALSATATASSTETSDYPASKANDGDGGTRWASARGDRDQTLQLAWDSVQTMKGFVVKWERRNATNYAIETSNDGNSWTEVASFTQKPAETVQKITLDAPVQAQYVRLNIKTFTADGLGGETSWNVVSVYEFEVYEGEIPVSALELVARVTAPEISEDGTHISMPDLGDGVKVRFCADYEQVIGEDGTIYKPLSDKVVKGFYEVSVNGEKANSQEYTISVPGRYEPEENANAKPSVIPELQEWHGTQGQFAVSAVSKIVADKELADAAKKFAEDYEIITGSPIQVVTGGIKDVSEGDFYLTLDTAEKGLGKEGYVLKIGNAVLVEASDAVGVYWGVISILQILKQTQGVMPRGIVRDYPKYEVRAFSFDLGRKPFDLETVYDFARNMSWYKMNSLQLHLSDNLIFHEDYPDLETAAAQSYAGFRLESDKKNEETGVTLMSQDMYYTKEDFKEFVKDAQTRGVSIVPEFDMPAHALPITRVYEEYMTKKAGGSHGYLIEELNLTNEGSFAWAKSIWQEYFDGGKDAVFADIDTIHIGTDEYHGEEGKVGKELFRRFSKEMIEFVQGTKTADGKTRTVRMWGSLTNKAGDTPVPSKDVQLNIWNTGYANPQVMYNSGYELINTLEGPNYIVPAAGYYNDYINAQNIYNSWEPNSIGNLNVSEGDDQILGGCYAIWHDSVDTRGNGISQYDSFDRFYQPLPAYSARLWGEAADRTYEELRADVEKLGTAPGTKVYGEVESVTKTVLDYTFDEALTEDSSANSYDAADSKNVTQADLDGSKALRLNGGESYLTTPDNLDKIGGNGTLTMRVKMDTDAEGEQILCESKDAFGAYGTYAIKAVQKHTGKVGFSREGYDYSFNYTLPKGEWVELTFKGAKDTPELYVNGTLIDNKIYDEDGNLATVTKGNGTTIISKNNNPDIYFANHETTELSAKLAQTGITKTATMMLPLGRIGSATKSFKGLIDGVTVSVEKPITGDYSSAAVPQGEMTATGCSDHSEGRFPAVLDGDTTTYWHTDWSQNSEKNETKDHDHYLTLTFNNNAAKTVNMLTYLPRQNSTNGRITQYSIDITKADGTVVTNYASGTWASDMTEKAAVFEPIEAKSVKLNILASEATHGTAAELNLYHVNVNRDAITTALAPYKNLNSSDYTAQSWNAVTEAIAMIETIVSSQNSTIEDLFAAYGSVQSLDSLLVRKPEVENNIETSELQAKQEERAEELKNIDESLYTEESVALLKEYLKEAEKILKNPVTKAEVADIMEKLEVALVERPADMDSVSSAVAEAEKVNLKEYTAESAAEYAKALADLKEILGNPNALQKEAKAALDALAAAKAKLQKIIVPDPGNPNPGNPNPGNPNPGNPNPGNPNPVKPIFKPGAEEKVGNGRYKVINAKNKTAKLVSVINKKKATLNVPATVKIAGVTCKVTEVGASVMKGNTKLKKVVLGTNVTTISKQAFMGCKNLKSVQLKGKALKSIKTGAFKKTSAKLTVSAKKMSKKQKAKLLKQLKKAGAGKKTKVK